MLWLIVLRFKNGGDAYAHYIISTSQKITEDEIRAPQEDEVVWIRMLKPSPEEVKHVLDDIFQCHPLLVEDCINMKQRPKMDRYKESNAI